MKRIIPILALFLCVSNNIAKAQVQDSDLVFFDALAMKESHNKPLSPRYDTNGKIVLGYFQITKDYWQDAYDADPSIGGSWEQCQYDKGYGETVIIAYMSHYVPRAVATHNYEVIARCHNGGPKGYKYRSTVAYWQDVKARMESE